MSQDAGFYLTTTLPYVNAEPHIGFGLEIVAGDVICRFQRLLGKEVIFNTGTDEHGQKIYGEALKRQQTPQEYVNEYAAKFDSLKQTLNLSYDRFIRTTDPQHIAAAEHFWQVVNDRGFIYKKNYQAKYCVGCELEKTDSELIGGQCALHPTKQIEIIEENNYFFKFSAFTDELLQLYADHPSFVKPVGKHREIEAFVKQGLKDFSISRLKTKMPWGIPIPGDEDQVMYVWFDALINYISTLGWPDDQVTFKKFWPGIQLAGKDNLRQQSAMWQAMLLAAGLPPSKLILINGFINIDSQKMSKSTGNVITPQELVDRYSVDGARYLLMNLGVFGEDMDVTWERLDTTYTADLANGLGNLCSRVAKLCEQSNFSLKAKPDTKMFKHEFLEKMNNFALSQALAWIVTQIDQQDKYLAQQKPWTQTGSKQAQILEQVVEQILLIAHHLQPFMPATAQKLEEHFSAKRITALTPLFPRLG